MHPLEEAARHRFHNPALLDQAFAHPSLNRSANNQRLEFIGDAALGAAIARLLYTLYPKETEGELARRQAALVCGAMLTEVARELNMGAYLHISASEEAANGRDNPTNLEDALEAFIGALYLDAGMECVQDFIERHWQARAEAVTSAPKDAKTALQEWAQARGKHVPTYTVIASDGPAHAPRFTVEVAVTGYPPSSASAGSKRAAEQAAAKALLDALDS